MSSRRSFHRWMLVAMVLVAGSTARAGVTSVIALNEQDPNSFYLYGHGYLDVGTGSVQVNSNHNAAALFQGISLTFIAGELNVVGGYLERGNPSLVTETNPYGPAVPARPPGEPAGAGLRRPGGSNDHR